MSNQIVVKDIGALDQFASRLERAKQDLESVANDLRSAMSHVGGSWQDPQKDKCEREIESLRAQIRKFSDIAQQQVSYCKKLANHLRSTPR